MRVLGPALALAVLLPACGRSPGPSGPPSRSDGAAAIGDRPGVHLVQARQGQRLPFQLRLDAEDGSGGTWLLRLVLGCREGGTALVQFALTDGVSVADGETERTVSLAAGEERDEVLLIQVPPEGHHVAAAAVTLDGRKAEVYAEFGAQPSADAKGLKVRARNSGVRILRLGGGDKDK